MPQLWLWLSWASQDCSQIFSMPQVVGIIIAVVVIITLLVVFFVSFYLMRKTPAPKGCEDIKISEENCSACSVENCPIKAKVVKE